MSMKAFYELKDMLCGELDKFTKKSEINPQSLDMIDKLTHSIKSLETIIAMNEQDGESEMYPYYGGRAYQSGNNGGGGSNRRGRSNAQRRDSRGRYSNRENYSRDDACEDMIEDLRELMQDAPDERMKSKIQRFISEIENS